MDPRLNPYAPGAGFPPPELAGRDTVIENAAIALDRIRGKLAARSFVFYGLRGVGKTVLLNRIARDAESRGHTVVQIEMPEGRSLPGVLAPALRSGLLRMSRGQALRQKAAGALRVLAGFVGALKVKFNDIEVAVDAERLLGVGDSGDLETDLGDMLKAVGEAAQDHATSFVIFMDELQYVAEEQLGVFLSALHKVNQLQLPLTLVAAGLPQVLGLSGRAKSYAERLFEFVPIDGLKEDAARVALCLPAQRVNVAFEDGAVAEILQRTAGYPYFLQEWGKHSWNLAERSPIRRSDAEAATTTALAELDASFFRVRFDRLTPTEKHYIRAMAELGAGSHRSGDIAEQLGKTVTQVAPVRSGLIRKGMIYSPAFGDTAFTVPLFDGFMKRVMPVFETD